MAEEEEGETLTLTVEGGAEERRLDQWLARRLPELTRSRIQALARQGLLTDAEGRLVLGDCLTFVEKEYKPERIVDLATLTGAIVVALGSEMAGLFSNDDALSELLEISGGQAGEELWRFPMTDAYRKLIKSDMADIKNISDGRAAGSITAACFLEAFLPNKTPWAHLDIAGMDMIKYPKTYIEKFAPLYPKGASGFGVMLINRFLRNLERK